MYPRRCNLHSKLLGKICIGRVFTHYRFIRGNEKPLKNNKDIPMRYANIFFRARNWYLYTLKLVCISKSLGCHGDGIQHGHDHEPLRWICEVTEIMNEK